MSRYGRGRNLVLQPLELLAERVGQEVRHDADELADLDEQAAQPQDRRLDAARVRAVLGRGHPFDGLRPAKAARDASMKYDSATWVVTK